MFSDNANRQGVPIGMIKISLTGNIPDNLDRVYDANPCIHEIAEEKYGDEFPEEAENLGIAALSIGEKAKQKVDDLRRIITDQASNYSERQMCKAYVGARAFNNGD
jgi:hypothetical protein